MDQRRFEQALGRELREFAVEADRMRPVVAQPHEVDELDDLVANVAHHAIALLRCCCHAPTVIEVMPADSGQYGIERPGEVVAVHLEISVKRPTIGAAEC